MGKYKQTFELSRNVALAGNVENMASSHKQYRTLNTVK